MELVKGFFPTIPDFDNRILAKIDDIFQCAKGQKSACQTPANLERSQRS